MLSSEHIAITSTDPDAWLCVCGNTPTADGFYPCDARGGEVEPTAEAWTTNCYACARCGRIIDQGRLEVVGRAAVHPGDQEPPR